MCGARRSAPMQRSAALLLQVLALGAATAAAAAAAVSAHPAGLQSFDYAELAAPQKDVLDRLKLALTKTGALQIKGVPAYSESRKAALGAMADCLAKEDESNVTKMTMPDGSPRITAHAASTRGAATAFASTCGDSASNLRAAIDVGTRRLLQALDTARVSSVDVMRPYHSYEDVQRFGEHLEHIHAYWSPPSSTATPAKPTVDFHTDGGLFIAMTSGLYSSAQQGGDDGEGLYLELADGAVLRVKSSETQDSLVFLVGEAGSKWLAPVLGQPLRAVPHKLVAALPSGESRAWYGKMFLPPADAFVAPAAQTYAAVREQINRALSSGSGDGKAASSLPVACGPSSYLTSSTGCTASDGSAGVECWMTCMSASALWCGQQAVCYDSASDSVNNGDTMCQATCSLKCPNTYVADADNSSQGGSSQPNNDYCYGFGTTMIMSCFTSQLASGTQAPCMNFLFPKWELNSSLKFGAACIGSFLLGVFLHFVTKVRLSVGRWKLSQKRTLALCGLYCANTGLGYLLMLLAMTYSTELFLMVLSGLTVGYGIFLVDQPSPISTDPCCSEEDPDSKDSQAASSGAGRAPATKAQGTTLSALLLAPSSHSLLVNSD